MMEGPWCRFRREARAREDIDTVAVDSLKALDPEWPIREADNRCATKTGQIRKLPTGARRRPDVHSRVPLCLTRSIRKISICDTVLLSRAMHSGAAAALA